MTSPVISVEKLGKRYRLGQLEPYKTLREAIARKLGRPFDAASTDAQSGNPANTNYVWALRDVSFEVHRGEVLGVIGLNGAGKTTLLKVLSRITEPTEGKASILGRVGSLLEVGTGFHPELTGRENVYLNGAVLGMRKKETEEKFEEIVAFAELEKFMATPVKRYSSGMYVRLAFAVAAHFEPEILLVDEVLAVGDVSFQKKCLGRMGKAASEGRTVLFVSHNMAAVENLCSQAMLLTGGRVGKSGSVSDVIEYYLSTEGLKGMREDGLLARSPDGSLELLSVGPTDENGRRVPVVQCGRDLRLAIRLETSIPLPRAVVAVGINSLHDTRVAVVHSSIAGDEISLTPGRHSVICRVPRLPLSPGGYFLDVKVLSRREVMLWAPHVEQLVVEAGDFHNTGKSPDPDWGGFIQMNQHWEVQDDER